MLSKNCLSQSIYNLILTAFKHTILSSLVTENENGVENIKLPLYKIA